MSKKSKLDWEGIETDYRCGAMSLRAMAEKYGCGESTIRKHADKHDWVRDLAAKVKARAEDMVRKEEVRSKVRSDTTPTEKQQIEISALIQKDIILNHRASIGTMQSICDGMTEELIAQKMSQEELARIAALTVPETSADSENLASDIDKAIAAWNKLLGLSVRVDTLRRLVESKKILVSMEREAFGIAEKEPLDRNFNLNVSFVSAVVQHG